MVGGGDRVGAKSPAIFSRYLLVAPQPYIRHVGFLGTYVGFRYFNPGKYRSILCFFHNVE